MRSILSPKKYIQTKGRLLPIHECYVNSEWQEAGMVNIFISRKQPSGNFIIGIYLIDLYATGLKDTIFLFNQTAAEYEDLIKSGEEEQSLISCSYELAHNIIYEGISYAEELGFTPHKDFEITKYIIEEDTEDIEEMPIECGLHGKPCVVTSPSKPQTKIIAQLEHKMGAGNFTVLMLNDDNEEDKVQNDEGYEEEDLLMDFEDDYEEEDEDDEEDDDDDDDFEESMKILEMMENNTTKSYEEIFGKREESERLDESRLIPTVINYEGMPEIESLPLAEQLEVLKFTALLSSKTVDSSSIRQMKTKLKKFPDSPIFYELLATAYSVNGKLKESESMLKSAFDKFPSHIFTRLSYCKSLLINNKLNEFRNHLGVHPYLDEIAPERAFYYKGEVRFYLQTMLAYYIATDEIHFADQIIQTVKTFDHDEKEDEMGLIAMRLQLIEAKLKKIKLREGQI